MYKETTPKRFVMYSGSLEELNRYFRKEGICFKITSPTIFPISEEESKKPLHDILRNVKENPVLQAVYNGFIRVNAFPRNGRLIITGIPVRVKKPLRLLPLRIVWWLKNLPWRFKNPLRRLKNLRLRIKISAKDEAA